MKSLLWVFSLLLLPLSTSVQASTIGGIALEHAEIDLYDNASLKRGAILFSNYCMACHSIKYIRYNRISRNLNWGDEVIIEEMAYGQNTVVEDVMARMLPNIGMQVFGIEPPDLSLMSRLKGTDYIYSLLRGYEQKEDGSWDNRILKNTVMPNVLEGIKRYATPEEYDQATRDIANFLTYVGEPSKVERLDLGWKVIAFLLVLLLLSYLLKREYWRDIKH